MAGDNPTTESVWTPKKTIFVLVVLFMGAIGGCVFGVLKGLELGEIFLSIWVGFWSGMIVVVIAGAIYCGKEGPTNSRSRNQAANDQKTNVRPEPALKKEDLKWSRVGDDEIHGQCCDFVLHLKMFVGTQWNKSHYTVRVFHSGKFVADYRGDSAESAIEKGLSFVRRQLADRRAADDLFGRLTGRPSGSRAPLSPASTVNRDRKDFQRYMA